jgi:hypothetical protein
MSTNVVDNFTYDFEFAKSEVYRANKDLHEDSLDLKI